MNLPEALEKTKDIPFIDESKRIELYEFVKKIKPNKILELGFAHGVSTCIMASALDEMSGHRVIDTIDILPAKEWQENLISIEKLSSIMGLESFINIYRENKSYTWWLKKEVEKRKNEENWKPYDFIFIDGSHNWTIDSSAFFLCEKLLRNGGWILFDDLKYSYSHMISVDGRNETAGVTHYDMSPDELCAPHVGLIFELLVKDHEHFGEFRYSQDNDWGWAKKVKGQQSYIKKTVVQYSLFEDIKKFKRAIMGRLRS